MLASVLNSPLAIEASVRVVRTFVFMREQLAKTRRLNVADFARKLAELEGRVGQHDEDLQAVFTAIRELIESAEATPVRPRRRIGFAVDVPRQIRLPESRRAR